MATLRNHEAIKSKSDQFRVDPRALKVESGFNVRDLDAPVARDALDRLKDSIRSEGVQDPLEIRMIGDDLYVVSGHRRLKCVMELIAEGHDIETVPAIAEPKVINDAERTARLITLNSGEPLSALEKAEVVRRLVNYGWPRDKICSRLGFKSVQTVANYEMLLGSPEEIQAAVRSGELSATSAVDITRDSDGDSAKASETLAKARQTSKAAGKGKVTSGAVSNALGRPSRPAAEPKADSPHAMADLDKAIALLAAVAAGTISAQEHAELYIAKAASEVGELADWFIDFADALRDKERTRDARAMIRFPTINSSELPGQETAQA